jgi:hypothetical protein
MASVSVSTASRFITAARLPAVVERLGRPSAPSSIRVPGTEFDQAKDQAAVVGSEVVSFAQGVPAERREAIANSILFAQQFATQRVPDRTQIFPWYDQYFSALTQLGWVVQEKNFQEFKQASQSFEAHKAIIAVATTLFGATPTALALVKTTLESLQAMDQNSPWISLFNTESEHADTARFQIGLAEQTPDGKFVVSLMAFVLTAKASVTQALFFKSKSSEASLRHSSGRVGINTDVLDGVRGQLKEALITIASDFIKTLPPLGASKART